MMSQDCPCELPPLVYSCLKLASVIASLATSSVSSGSVCALCTYTGPTTSRLSAFRIREPSSARHLLFGSSSLKDSWIMGRSGSVEAPTRIRSCTSSDRYPCLIGDGCLYHLSHQVPMMLPLMLQPQPFFLSLLDCIWCNSSVQPEAVLQPFLNFRCSSANSIASSAPAASTLI